MRRKFYLDLCVTLSIFRFTEYIHRMNLSLDPKFMQMFGSPQAMLTSLSVCVCVCVAEEGRAWEEGKWASNQLCGYAFHSE